MLSNNINIDLGRGGILRPLQKKDITQEYIDGINAPEIRKFLSAPNAELQTFETVRLFVEQNNSAKDAILFGLFVNKIHCGNVRLHEITTEKAYIGIALFLKKVWRQNWGSTAISASVQYANQVLHIKQILAGIDDNNIASKKSFAKAGFRMMPHKIFPTKSSNSHFWQYII